MLEVIIAIELVALAYAIYSSNHANAKQVKAL